MKEVFAGALIVVGFSLALISEISNPGGVSTAIALLTAFAGVVVLVRAAGR